MAYILIVEDDESINELIARNLKLVGHTFIQAFDGLAAVKEATVTKVTKTYKHNMLQIVEIFKLL